MFRFTISALLNIEDSMVLIDSDSGRESSLTSDDVHWILGIGWASSVIALMLNFIYYKLHPSAVDFDLGRFRNRIVLYICGVKFFKKGGLLYGWLWLIMKEFICCIEIDGGEIWRHGKMELAVGWEPKSIIKVLILESKGWFNKRLTLRSHEAKTLENILFFDSLN